MLSQIREANNVPNIKSSITKKINTIRFIRSMDSTSALGTLQEKMNKKIITIEKLRTEIVIKHATRACTHECVEFILLIV